jgi:pimeloyl-ACP methyl ester carboxylesterase
VKLAWERHGEGAPLLLIHGLGYARWGWEPVVDGLARSFDVILFDNRGIGESEAPPGPYTTAQLAADALQVLDEAGVARAHVLGTSLGGMVAQELALASPERVDRLVLVCTTPGGPESFPMPEQTVKLMGSGASLRQFVENALAPDADAELVERILRHREATAQPLDAWAAQAAAGGSFDALDRIEGIAAPTLVLHGTEDAVVDSRNTALLALRIPDARVELFPGGGHLLFWEQPDRFVEVVTEFLLGVGSTEPRESGGAGFAGTGAGSQ